MNALIIETAFLGDVILSLALAEELKRLEPTANISYLVRPDVENLLSFAPAVDNVIVFDKKGADSGADGIRRMAERLNALQFDTVLQLHDSARTRRLVALLNADTKIGFGNADGRMTNVVDANVSSRSSRAISLLMPLFQNPNLSTLPRLVPPIPDVMRDWQNPGVNTIALAPGSVWATKRWGDEKYCKLAIQLVRGGSRIAVIGANDVQEFGNKLEEELGHANVLNLAGKTSLAESAGAISICDLLIGNDSAPIHLSTAVGTRSIAIFGPTLPSFGFAPPASLGVTVELTALWCRPCGSHGYQTCPVYTHECMERISVESVLQRALAMVAQVDP